MLALLLGGKLDLPHGRVNALRERRQRRTDAGLEQCIRPLEQPRITERTSPDHHAVRAGVRENADRVLGFGHISVGEHRNANRLLDFTNHIPVGGAAVLLRARASVQRDRCRAGLLSHFCKFHAVDAFFIPALAKLDRYRYIDRVYDRCNHLGRQLRVLHQRGAVTVVYDLRRRTAHVDIDDITAGFLQRQFRAFGHRVRLVPENLGSRRMLVRPQLEQTRRFLILIAQRLCGDHFGHGQRRAVLPADMAECKIGHACHRCKRQFSVDCYVADLHIVPPSYTYYITVYILS